MKHVYCNDVTDWFVAETLEHAVQIARKYYEDTLGGVYDQEYLELQMVPDDEELAMFVDESERYQLRMAAAQFAAEYPVGFLMTTEY